MFTIDEILTIWQAQQKQSTIPVQGSSMLPLLRQGDQALVDHARRDIQRGQIIVFQHNNGLIIHRVIRVKPNEADPIILTKGDYCLHFDPLIKRSQVLGQVLTIQRGQGTWSVDTPKWRLIGWLIAVSTYPIGLIYMGLRQLKHRLLGKQRHPLTSFLHRLVRTIVIAPLQLFKPKR